MLDLSCPDWEDRLRTGRSLIPCLPSLPNQEMGERAVQVFNKLRLFDVPGTPTMEEAAGEWFRDAVRALFASLDPVSGIRLIRELFVLVSKKNNKALRLDTLIATPTGFTTMGEVQVGDLVLDADGKPTPVVRKSEVFTGRQCLEVEFSTGERVVCDADHLWVTDAHLDRRRTGTQAPSAKTTAHIAETLTVKSGDLRINNHRTALCGSLELPDAKLPIHPYVLGAWLGDGDPNAPALTKGRGDAEHMVARFVQFGQPARIIQHDPRSTAVSISLAGVDDSSPHVPDRFSTAAWSLGLFGNKHVPTMYLRGSREQRLELLRGLMDTDGWISKAGQAVFTTTLARLRDDVVELVNSLGLKASVCEYQGKLKGKDYGPAWNVQFWPFDDPLVFTIPRKRERQHCSRASNSPRSRTRQIVAVREVESVPTQCLGVASDTHQFLVTRSLIPTHNTTGGALLMLTALLLNQRPRAPFLLTGPVQKTADDAFAAIEGAVALDNVLNKKVHVRDHIKTIVHRETKAKLEILTFDPAIVTGKKVVGALIDEEHILGKMPRANKAMIQLRGGMMPFPEAFLAIITTQSDEAPAGVFAQDLKKAREIRDGKRTGNTLPLLYEFPKKMQQDKSEPWRNPATWHMVNPNMGRSIARETLEAAFKEEEEKGAAELRMWASQHLNIQIGVALKNDAWVGAELWEQQSTGGLTLVEVIARSEVLTVGIDGGGLQDLLGVTVIGRERETRNWLSWSHAYADPIVLERRKDIASKLEDFAEDGDLTIMRIGDDMKAVADVIECCEDSGLLDNIGVDQAGIASIVKAITARGIGIERIVGIPQGWKLMGAIKTVERALAAGELFHGGTRLMAWAVGNARVVPRDNAVLITKEASGSGKIDPLMSLFDAAALMAMDPQPKTKTYQVFFA